jgi:hypothetical protein
MFRPNWPSSDVQLPSKIFTPFVTYYSSTTRFGLIGPHQTYNYAIRFSQTYAIRLLYLSSTFRRSTLIRSNPLETTSPLFHHRSPTNINPVFRIYHVTRLLRDSLRMSASIHQRWIHSEQTYVALRSCRIQKDCSPFLIHVTRPSSLKTKWKVNFSFIYVQYLNLSWPWSSADWRTDLVYH